jgi:hypothetical protein
LVYIVLEIFLVNKPMNDPRGQTRAQCIFPRPQSVMTIGVNMQTNPYSPKGFQMFAMVIQRIVIIHDQL